MVQIRRIKSLDQRGRQRISTEIHFIVGQQPQAVKVKEQRLLIGRLRGVPWRACPLRVLQYVNVIAKTLRPVIQILLVPEFAILGPRKAPFDAALFPPTPYGFSTPTPE